MTVTGIDTVCFVGAGTMGAANSLVAAASGYDVVIYDLSEASLAAVPQKHEEMGGYLVSIGFCSSQHVADSARRIRAEADLARAVEAADLVSESVVEVLEVKREVHARIDELAPERTIQTTNTSGFLVSEIEDAVTRGDRFAALHSHLGSPLIDIVPGPRTDPAVLTVLSRYVESLQCVPLVLHRENRGYVLNAMLGPVITAAMLLVADGISTRDEVDRAWMKYRRGTMGPFGMMDLFGLNVVYDGWQERQSDSVAVAIRGKILPLLERYLERGELGVGRLCRCRRRPRTGRCDDDSGPAAECGVAGGSRRRQPRRDRPRLDGRHEPGPGPFRHHAGHGTRRGQGADY
jgi:3-hydroxybutyryl-CoA dehydrogenase